MRVEEDNEHSCDHFTSIVDGSLRRENTIGYTSLAPKDAVELAIAWNDMEALVKTGGLYKEGEYKTFVHKGLGLPLFGVPFGFQEEIASGTADICDEEESKTIHEGKWNHQT